jgi:hypothetical protein
VCARSGSEINAKNRSADFASREISARRLLWRFAFREPDVRLYLADGQVHVLSGNREAYVRNVSEIEQAAPELMQMMRRKWISDCLR